MQDVCNPETAAWAVRMIIGSFPNRKAPDPETYVSQLATLISTYPTWLVKNLANPKTGIVIQSQFLPTLSEIRKFADDQYAARHQQLQRSARPQIAHEPAEEALTDEERARRVEILENLVKGVAGRLAPPSRARRHGYAEEFWDADEHTEVHRATRDRFLRTQCDPKKRNLSEYGLD